MNMGRKVWISLDGKSPGMQRDRTKEVREVASRFLQNWPNQVTLLVHDVNLGLQTHCISTIQKFFHSHESGIILEDDVSPTRNFFDFMDYALEEHRNNHRIFAINGWTPFLQTDLVSQTHLTRYFIPWGWGSWSDRVEMIDFEMKTYNRKTWHIGGTISSLRKNLGFRNYWTRRFDMSGLQGGCSYDWAFLYEMWRMNGMCVSPSERMVTNIGYDEMASHSTPGSIRQRASAREDFQNSFSTSPLTYNLKLDLRFERLMWDLGRQRVISSLTFRMNKTSEIIRNSRSLRFPRS